MNRPRKAVVLAAGFGTRLLPLTRIVPKPLLPLGGAPMLERVLSMVRKWGVRDVLVNVHHGTDALVRHLVQRNPDGLRIQISFEPEILGTGGALTKASWFLADDRPFWMLNADIAAEVDGTQIARAFRPGKTIAAAWLMSTRGPRTVSFRNGLITNFRVPRPGTAGTYTFCGVHLVDPAVLRYLPEGFSSIITAYERAMADGWKVAGAPIEDAYWADIGTPANYIEADAAWAHRSAPAGRDASPGKPSVSIKNGMIYGPGVPRKKFSGIMAMRARDALDAAEWDMVRAWTRKPEEVVACPLAPRGSARSFTRLYHSRRTAMLVRHQPDREENNLYTGHARFLAGLGLPVPAVLGEDPHHHLALYEDAGTDSVQDQAARRSSDWLEKRYADVMDHMVVFHESGYRAARRKRLHLMPGFDARLYRWEHDLFTGLFLRDLMKVKEDRIVMIQREMAGVSSMLAGARPVLLHRDLQSSNILLRGRRWAFIDFQGMRFGPAVYDLASLLCDPYIKIDAAVRERLLARYAAGADPKSRVRELFWPAAIQRLGQALGAYARLSKQPETRHFARHIPPALQNLGEALAHVPNLPVLDQVVRNIRLPDSDTASPAAPRDEFRGADNRPEGVRVEGCG